MKPRSPSARAVPGLLTEVERLKVEVESLQREVKLARLQGRREALLEASKAFQGEGLWDYVATSLRKWAEDIE